MTTPLLLLALLACTSPPDDTARGGGDGGADGGSGDGGSGDGGSDGGNTDGGSDDGGSTDGGNSDGGSTDPSACAPAEPLDGFVWREGGQLHDGDGVFRFASVNVPNLHVVEDGGWHLPTEWEQRDALCAVRQIGGRVARTYVLSVGESGVDLPRHVTAPGVLEEELMVALDQALAVANEQGVRLIIPLVDQWTWWGGIEDHAAFRGLPASAFWTDEQVIADFEATITALLTRTNTITGVPYVDDPAILAWETGNELDAPTEWTLRIAAHIRSLDDNHLVMDGQYGIDEGVLDSPDIDIVSNHYYWPWPYGDDNAAALRADMELLDGRRPFLLGEFGLLSTDRMLETLDEAVAQEHVAGALIWSLRFHADPGGFYWHSEGMIGDVEHRSFRWPGFESGDAYGERDVLAGLRDAAWAMREQTPPDLEPPDPPQILSVDSTGTVTWRGATGAGSYVLERTGSADGPWTVVAEGFDDAQVELVAEVTDPSLVSGDAWYRMAAVNDAGTSPPSEAFGPVSVQASFVDPLDDLSLVTVTTGSLGIDSSNSGYFDGDTGRLYRTAGGDASATWALPADAETVEVVMYAWPSEATPELLLAVSTDGVTFTDLDVTTTALGGDWEQFLLTADTLPTGVTDLRLTFVEHAGEVWNPQVGELRVGLR